jgi:hypothetical protein
MVESCIVDWKWITRVCDAKAEWVWGGKKDDEEWREKAWIGM